MYSNLLGMISDLYVDHDHENEILVAMLDEVGELRNTLKQDLIPMDAILGIPDVLSTVSCLDLIPNDSQLVSSFTIEYSTVQEPMNNYIPFSTVPAMGEVSVIDISHHDIINDQICMVSMKRAVDPRAAYTNLIYVENKAIFGKIGQYFPFQNKEDVINCSIINPCISFAIKKLIGKFLDVIEYGICIDEDTMRD